MKHFTIDTENNITVHASRNAARYTGAGIFATEVQFADLIGGQLRKKEKASDAPGRGVDAGAAFQISAMITAPLNPSLDQNQTSDAGPNPDPLANVRGREERRPGFNYNSQPDLRKLI